MHWVSDFTIFIPHSTESNAMDRAVSNSDVMVDELCKPPKCLFFFPTEAHSELSCLHFFSLLFLISWQLNLLICY